jgi:sugar phosphate isomerase/epimerase
MSDPYNLTSRRAFVGGFLGAGLLLAADSGTKTLRRSQISAITDEIARTPADAIAFAHQYGLKWLEVRSVPGARQSYASMGVEDAKAAAAQFAEGGVKISFFDSPNLKIWLPGTTPAIWSKQSPDRVAQRRERDQAAFDRRVADLEEVIRNAQILGVDKVRVFTFLRTEEPEKEFQKIADALGPLGNIAQREGIKLLVENEASCNVATSAELAGIMKLLPEKPFGLNWDPHNAMRYGEKPFPDGFNLLPEKRILNVQIKARSILPEYTDFIDWDGVFKTLAKDDYPYCVGLETHIFGDKQIATSHECMKAILHLVES